MQRKPCTPLVAIQWHSTDNRWLHVQVACRRWSCAHCGPIRRYLLQKSTLKAQEDYGLNWFLTLTLPGREIAPAESAQHIQKSWNKFLVLVRRHYGKLRFVAFKEFQKNGIAHIHALIDQPLNATWISKTWAAVGGGIIVDIRPVQSDGSVRYLTKYVTKAPPIKLPKAYRRVSASKGIVLFPKNPKGQFKAFNVSYDLLVKRMLQERVGTLSRNGEEIGFIASKPARLLKG